MLEKRRHARTSIDLPVTFSVKGSTNEQSGVGRDISIGGMYIETGAAARFGAEIVVRVNLPTADGSRATFELPGVVRWVRSDGMGVQFGLLGVHETRAITEASKDVSS